jgi:hypothetical protein
MTNAIETEVYAVNPSTGPDAGTEFFSAWAYIGEKAVHIGHFDTKWEAKRATETALEIGNLVTESIRGAIANAF